jgi:uncharacterized caspase-like protein/peptidoglycan/xylan/chitin deacetylase (PgdA/CDA1 family)
MKRSLVVAIAVALSAVAIAAAVVISNKAAVVQEAPPAATSAAIDVSGALEGLRELLGSYRKIIVLLADEKSLSTTERDAANQVGQALFHDNLARIGKLDEEFAAVVGATSPARFEALDKLLAYIESDPALFDADRLAFREVLQSLRDLVTKDGSLPAIKVHKRISEDLDALAEIERNYEKEIHRIFDRFEQRAIVLKREKWDDYVAHLKKIYSREQILKDHGFVMPYPEAKKTSEVKASEEGEEIFGRGLPKKTLALTFDDGPHRLYSDEIAAILKQYGVPAIFFNVGRNLGRLDDSGRASLSAGAAVSRRLMANGHVLGNHSYSHAQLSKRTGDDLKSEIFSTDSLLKAVDPARSELFRFPYGARSGEGRDLLSGAHLKSMMWNIDSLDWADPVPRSIADRVLRTVEKEGRGIILFHDIHERTVKALPLILDRLVADGYQFAGWDGTSFKVAGNAGSVVAEKPAAATEYGTSWAVVIGVDAYGKWPRLQYAVRDAQAVRQTLIEKFGFKDDHVFALENGDATRNNILAMFHDKLAHGGVGKSDRIFVFFAGHGATRRLSSGRDLGYIVPVDSDPNQFATDAIPMTEIQNVAESLSARHVLFVMDACYSGLGLTRGGAGAYLKENARRVGRQMLTAGGTDQLVADGGPNGHSVFSWTLLQGLSGKADLNGDGLIAATELAAYVAPAVSAVSQQTPAFGSLPGSEGGDFVFELPGETEFLSPQTTQLSGEAIALNSKLDATRPASALSGPESVAGKAAPAAIAIKDLQGNEQTIAPPAPVPLSARQQAQRANDRGLQLYREKQYEAAEAQFTEALKLRPDFALAANNLGFVYFRQEKYKEAARWFENTIKMDRSRAIAYLNLGDAYARGSQAGKAKEAYKTYLELAPNGPAAGYVKLELQKL